MASFALDFGTPSFNAAAGNTAPAPSGGSTNWLTQLLSAASNAYNNYLTADQIKAQQNAAALNRVTVGGIPGGGSNSLLSGLATPGVPGSGSSNLLLIFAVVAIIAVIFFMLKK